MAGLPQQWAATLLSTPPDIASTTRRFLPMSPHLVPLTGKPQSVNTNTIVIECIFESGSDWRCYEEAQVMTYGFEVMA